MRARVHLLSSRVNPLPRQQSTGAQGRRRFRRTEQSVRAKNDLKRLTPAEFDFAVKRARWATMALFVRALPLCWQCWRLQSGPLDGQASSKRWQHARDQAQENANDSGRIRL